MSESGQYLIWITGGVLINGQHSWSTGHFLLKVSGE